MAYYKKNQVMKPACAYMEALLDNGASPEATDRWGCSVRLFCAVFGSPDVVGVIADWQKRAGSADALGNAILAALPALTEPVDAHPEQGRAQDVRHHHNVGLLLAHGVAPDAFLPIMRCLYDGGLRRLMSVAGRNRLLVQLLDSGLDPCAQDHHGTLLHQLCALGAPSPDLTLAIDAGGRDAINRRDRHGDTPLHSYLAHHPKLSVASLNLLLENNADTSLANGDGMDLIQIINARADGAKVMEQFLPQLLEHGYQDTGPHHPQAHTPENPDTCTRTV